MLRSMSLLAVSVIGCLLGASCGDDDVPRRDGALDQGRLDANVDGGTGDAASRDGARCQLDITEISGTAPGEIAQIDSRLDQDSATAGVQLSVSVAASNAADGTTVTLAVTDVAPAPTAIVSSGVATFEAITVDPTQTALVSMTPSAPGCSGQQRDFNTQTSPDCSFEGLDDSTQLSGRDDKLSGNNSFDYDVVVNTINAFGGSVRLEVQGTQVGSVQPDGAGTARFLNTILPSTSDKRVTLRAIVSLDELSSSCSVTITVDTEGPTCELGNFDPAPRDTARGPGLGQEQDADPSTDLLQTTITVNTDGDSVELSVNGTAQSGTPNNSVATFNLALEEGPVVVQAACTDSGSGNVNQSQQAEAIVDTESPAAVSDLACRVINSRRGEAECVFTVPTDLAVENCRLHYRQNSDIDDSNFDAEDTAKIERLANPSGQQQRIAISALSIPNSYEFAVKCVDFLGNEGVISNLPDALLLQFTEQVLVGQADRDLFGQPFAAGDFNCDGFADVAVGIQRAGDNDAGEVQIYYGGAVGLPPTFSKRFSGTIAGGGFGTGLFALNFDGDEENCDDLAVWAPHLSVADRGSVYVYLGSPTLSDRTDGGTGNGADVIYALADGAGAATELLGVALAAADLDGDGLDDLAMTRRDSDGGRPASILIDYGATGIARMESGRSPEMREMPGSAKIIVEGGTWNDLFGFLMGRAGRIVSSTEATSLLIGAPIHNEGGQRLGAAYVLRSAPRSETVPERVDITSSSSRVLRILGPEAGSLFGQVVAGIGDTNGDGAAEFAVGAPGFGNNQGRAYLFDLTGTAPTSAADAKAVIINDRADGNDDFFGRAIAAGASIDAVRGADLNQDGLADLIIGSSSEGSVASGAAAVLFGRSGALSDRNVSGAPVVLRRADGGFSYSVRLGFMADVNGDGLVDILVSENGFDSNRGRFFVYY